MILCSGNQTNEEIQEVNASLAAAKDNSFDASEAAVSPELSAILIDEGEKNPLPHRKGDRSA